MNRAKGIVFDIMHFSVRDGPGIRTTVFLKGCPLRCQWCHNPESQSPKPELMFRPNLCIGCLECLEACPEGAIRTDGDVPVVDPERCVLCAACTEACTADARQIAGRELSVPDVMAEVLKDRPFFEESGGGVTISGGEPLQQPDFLAALLQTCQLEGLHTALDTSGLAAWDTLKSIAPLVDLFLFDIKAVDDETHIRFTGVSNRLILENLARLSRSGARILLRVPLIPGVNDSPQAVQALGELACGLPGLLGVELLPYHEAGVEKYRRLNRIYPLETAHPHERKHILEIAASLRQYNLPIKVGG